MSFSAPPTSLKRCSHLQPTRWRLGLPGLCLLWAAAGLLGCSDSEIKEAEKGIEVLAPMQESPGEPAQVTMDRALRQAVIRTAQEKAGPAYAVRAPGAEFPWVSTKVPGIRSWFSDKGLRVGQEAFDAKSWGLRLTRVGYGDRGGTVSKATAKVQGNRVTYQREADQGVAVEEWYLNGPMGLEHGFTLAARPPSRGAGRLVLEIVVEGGVSPSLRADGAAVLLTRDDGVQAATYSDLWVEDADRREVPAELEVQGRKILITVDDQGARYPLRVDPLVVFFQKLTAGDGANGDQLGSSVALDGETAVVGAERDNDKANDAGAAYVFVRSGILWTQQAQLTASDGAANDYFGAAVSVDGDTAAVGADYDDDQANNSGTTFVYVRNGTDWSEQQKLTAANGETSAHFGRSVSVEGDTVVVGAENGRGTGFRSGAAYVFVRSGTLWSEQQMLTATDGAKYDDFGWSVSLHGTTVAVGSADDDDRGTDSGSAYVFTRNGTAWSEQQKLTAPDGAADDAFGWFVSLYGDTVAVGAPANDGRAPNAGAAYVYTRSGTTWSEQKKLTASDGAADDGFGNAVSAHGDNLAVGAVKDDDRGNSSGSAYNFERSGTTWSELQKLTASDGASGDEFGIAVAMGNPTLLVGAPGNAGAVTNSGSAYIFAQPLPNGSPCTTGSICQSTFCVDGVCCDKACGGTVATDCQACSTAAGAAVNGTCGAASNTIECRAAVGDCDAAEKCDGTTTACPADAVQPTSHECRASTDLCDAAENCDGTNKVCPGDGVKPTNFECRGTAGDCDAAEKCDGINKVCPTDAVQPTNFECRGATKACDVAERCDGSTKGCPTDGFKPSTFECRGATKACDVPENCTGAAADCPVDGFKPTTFECRAATKLCDVAENCTGAAADCPADGLKPSTFECRASADLCDVAEKCNGTTKNCPADGVAPTTKVCRAANGACDVDDKCDGTTKACPKDDVAATTVTCRAASGACDVADKCDGASKACPADKVAATTAVCRSVAGACDVAETCDGTAKACPTDAFKASTVSCRAAAGVCDAVENCSGAAATCPTDVFKATTTVCRAAGDECNPAENCPGAAADCPKDAQKADNTPCLSNNGTCKKGKCVLKPDAGVVDAGPDGLVDGGKDALAEAGPDASQDAAQSPDASPLHLLGGHGCSMGGADGASAWALLPGLLVLGFFALRRGRRRAGIVLALLLVLGSTSVAQAQGLRITANTFRPTTARSMNYFATEDGYTLPNLSPSAGLLLSYAHRPLMLYDTANNQVYRELVSYQFNMDLTIALGLMDVLEIGLLLPVTLSQNSDDLAVVGGVSGTTAGAGMGDVHLVAKVGFFSEGIFSLGALLDISFPTGKEEHFLGNETITVTPKLLASLDTSIVDVGFNVGYRARRDKSVQLSNSQGTVAIDDEVLLSLGLRAHVWEDTMDLIADAFLAISMEELDKEEVPAELLVGARFYLPYGLSADVGAGPGLSSGLGTPVFRIFAGLAWQYIPEKKPAPPPPVDRDPDKDGILDPDDKCPNDPEDKDTFEDSDGCPDPDNDKDGILDTNDKCPNDPEDKDGFEDDDGCPDPDNDKDGILDASDKCPMDPEDKDGFEDADGCPDPDNDDDKILDKLDKCPVNPETYNGYKDTDGCPDVEPKAKVQISRTKITVPPVYFATAKDVILRKSHKNLKKVAELLKANTWVKKLSVEGHTDDRGKDAYNMDLSKRRAASVVKFLVKQGVEADRLASQGFGETKPITTNKTSKGRAQNRRVEFLVKDPPTAK